MKKVLIPIMAVALATLAGCENKERLTQEIQGTWTADPQRIQVTSAYEADVIKTYTFMPDSTATITAMVSASVAIPDTDTMVEPVSMSAAATATIKGTYRATSYNRVEIHLDMSSLQVNVDPSAVNFMYNGLTTDEHPEIGTLSEGYIAQLRSDLMPVMKADFAGSATLADIKITEGKATGTGASPATMTALIDATSTNLTKDI